MWIVNIRAIDFFRPRDRGSLGPIHSGCLTMNNEKQEGRRTKDEENKNRERVERYSPSKSPIIWNTLYTSYATLTAKD